VVDVLLSERRSKQHGACYFILMFPPTADLAERSRMLLGNVTTPLMWSSNGDDGRIDRMGCVWLRDWTRGDQLLEDTEYVGDGHHAELLHTTCFGTGPS
jgi:hypothetical protein